MPIAIEEMPPVTIVEGKELDTEEVFTELLAGGALKVRNYNVVGGKDVLIKLDARTYHTSLLSFDLKKLEEDRFWQLHDFTINSLVLHEVERFVEDERSPTYTPDHSVTFYTEDGVEDIDFIQSVWVDADGTFYYQLLREEGYWTEDELELYC